MNGIASGSMAHGPATRTFLDGSEYWVVELPSVRMGLGHFRPGWVWSQHAGAQTGRSSVAHIGYIQCGAMMIESADGHKAQLGPGDAFEVGPNHDAWVIGDELCIALDVSMQRPNGSASGIMGM